jgi:hypothetical protein
MQPGRLPVASGEMRCKHAFDEKCFELAEYFMSEPDGRWNGQDMNELAQLIQETIEDFLRAEEITNDA